MLEEGALQPVIGLLSSQCTESQREAALLLGQFATTDPDYKAKIVQRGAVPPLIEMLSHTDLQLKEMAAFALGRLAQNPDNQAGIVQVSSSGLSRVAVAQPASLEAGTRLQQAVLTAWSLTAFLPGIWTWGGLAEAKPGFRLQDVRAVLFALEVVQLCPAKKPVLFGCSTVARCQPCFQHGEVKLPSLHLWPAASSADHQARAVWRLGAAAGPDGLAQRQPAAQCSICVVWPGGQRRQHCSHRAPGGRASPPQV